MSDLDELYQSVILDHNKTPRNFRKLVDANAHAVAIEHMVLQNEGWERDEAVAEPAQS